MPSRAQLPNGCVLMRGFRWFFADGHVGQKAVDNALQLRHASSDAATCHPAQLLLARANRRNS